MPDPRLETWIPQVRRGPVRQHVECMFQVILMLPVNCPEPGLTLACTLESPGRLQKKSQCRRPQSRPVKIRLRNSRPLQVPAPQAAAPASATRSTSPPAFHSPIPPRPSAQALSSWSLLSGNLLPHVHQSPSTPPGPYRVPGAFQAIPWPAPSLGVPSPLTRDHALQSLPVAPVEQEQDLTASGLCQRRGQA